MEKLAKKECLHTAIAIIIETTILFISIAIIGHAETQAGIDPTENTFIGILQAMIAISFLILLAYELYTLDKTLKVITKKKNS